MKQILFIICMTLFVDGTHPEKGGTVQRLISQQKSLIQPGSSFIDASDFYQLRRRSLLEIHNETMSKSQVSCSLNVVNWSKWLLNNPVSFYKYGLHKKGKCNI